MSELEKLKKENEELKRLVIYLRRNCRRFCHLWCETFNPQHQLKTDYKESWKVPKDSRLYRMKNNSKQ